MDYKTLFLHAECKLRKSCVCVCVCGWLATKNFRRTCACGFCGVKLAFRTHCIKSDRLVCSDGVCGKHSSGGISVPDEEEVTGDCRKLDNK
jgi:hypothetical protein